MTQFTRERALSNPPYDGRLVDGKSIHSATLVGYIFKDKKPPYKAGNCFSMLYNVDGKDEVVKIVNMSYEDILSALTMGLSPPVKVLLLSSNVGVIYDRRISPQWLQNNYCTVCCPTHLLPLPQRLNEALLEEVGYYTRAGTGTITIDRDKYPKLPGEEQ